MIFFAALETATAFAVQAVKGQRLGSMRGAAVHPFDVGDAAQQVLEPVDFYKVLDAHCGAAMRATVVGNILVEIRSNAGVAE